jgi:tetratricopeptide (TPR) repeat protein
MPTMTGKRPAALVADGLKHHRAGRLDTAESAYRAALAADPAHPDALHLLGIVRHQQGAHAEALTLIERAIAGKPREAAFHNNRGEACRALGRLEDAVASYRQALALDPAFVDALSNLGAALLGLGRAQEAAERLEQALTHRPDFPEALANLGNAWQRLNEPEKALACYRRALALRPGWPEVEATMGAVLQVQGRRDEAIASYRRALAAAPEDAQAWSNLGLALHGNRRLADAEAAIRRALALAPDMAAAHLNLGLILQDQGRIEDAIASFERATALNPTDPNAHSNLGPALIEQGRLDDALQALERALALDPKLPEAHFNQSLVYLLRGDFARGWEEYRWQWRKKAIRDKFPQPLWDGGAIRDKTVLLYADQGLGDTIQFLRFVPQVLERAKAVIVQVQPGLRWMAEEVAKGATIVSRDDHGLAFDGWAPLPSLPHVLGIPCAAFAERVPYLAAPPARIARWRDRLGGTGFKVGIAWQGNPLVAGDRGRSIPLAHFAPLARVPHVRLISLQKKDGLEQLQGLPAGMAVETLGPSFDDGPEAFADAAAVIASLDLVVTSDTAIAHLAGALGRPVWVALKIVPDWRWMLDSDASPWYPTMRLFRQTQPHDWDEVFQRIQNELARAAAHR